MSFELDDLWLDRMRGWTQFSRGEKRRLYRIIMVVAVGVSYLVDSLLLGLFSLTGTVTLSTTLLYGGLGLLHVIVFSALHWCGFSERFRNPHLTVWQMLYAIGVQTVGILSAPQVTPLFMGLIFVIFAFGTLRISLKEAMAIGLLASIAIGTALLFTASANIGISDPSRAETILVAVAFTTVLFRSIGLGYYGTLLRMRMYEESRSFEAAANRDALTGSLSRRAILAVIEEQIDVTHRTQQPACVAMLDVDLFKQINDSLGHQKGDEVLRHLTMRMAGLMRATDRLGRYGGEEFMLVLPDTSIEKGQVLLERMRRGVGARPLPERSDDGMHITISAGITEILAEDSIDEVIRRADAALYAAKAAGRNSVFLYSGEPRSPDC